MENKDFVMEDHNSKKNGFAQQFVQFSLDCGVLKFGSFKTKAGRLSPYFFNAGLFNDGAALGQLARFYAECLLESQIDFDMIFGPAYKGIPLGATVAVELARRGKNVPFAYNRKEVKDHGEGGTLVGAPLKGRVLIIDDVISAGTAVRESIRFIQAAGAQAYAVAIALDRQEMATEKQADGSMVDVPYSAVQYVQNNLGLKVCSIARLGDLLNYLQQQSSNAMSAHLLQVQAYRDQYGV
jgi:orotate phosphoribosyltransferase